jgi:hypothetical protein
MAIFGHIASKPMYDGSQKPYLSEDHILIPGMDDLNCDDMNVLADN